MPEDVRRKIEAVFAAADKRRRGRGQREEAGVAASTETRAASRVSSALQRPIT